MKDKIKKQRIINKILFSSKSFYPSFSNYIKKHNMLVLNVYYNFL